MVTSSELRARARQSLAGQWGRSALFTLVMYAIAGGLGAIPNIGNIISFLISGALAFGVYAYYMNVARGERPAFAVLWSGFPLLWRTFVLYFFMTVFTLLWSLLLIVPGIIAAIRYSQAYFISRDNPEIGALEAIRRSKAMMAGHKGRFFVLWLSFIGWALLCIPTLLIGCLWLYPYFMTTIAHFHEDLRSQNSSFGGYNTLAPLDPPPHPQSF
ncbi:DUF975 family protein [Paenibacillus sp. R14(2021)]|uniref:DUF975 family protein n=1 Tax=Paenibacillus sp. R14(2021) TaxID=2859228 RepID=UPI001C6118BB|nr:DUF975 family protein [Paenibacillus sp. R14(2021)]